MDDQAKLDAARTAITTFVYANRVISWHSIHALVEISEPNLCPFIARALSELVQSNTIKRYEYTKDGNRRDEFYLPAEYRILI